MLRKWRKKGRNFLERAAGKTRQSPSHYRPKLIRKLRENAIQSLFGSYARTSIRSRESSSQLN